MSTGPSPASTISHLPFELRQALESGQCVLFIGAGIGGSLFDKDGKPLPYAPQLATEMAGFFGIAAEGSTDLTKISQVVEIRKRGRKELNAFLQKRLTDIAPNEDVRWLATRPWRAIFTTNYDNGIERAYELSDETIQNPVVATVTADVGPINPMIEVPIYHLHGALFGVNEPHVVITENDYGTFRERRKMLFDLLKKELLTSTILYIGYSHNDSNWKLLINELIAEIPTGSRPMSYRVAPHTPAIDKEILRSMGVATLDTDLQHFVEAARVDLAKAPTSIDLLKPIAKSIPSDLSEHFTTSPALIARLLSSWTYVNQAPIAESSNLSRFLKGDKANWGLIAQHDVLERDIEEEVYDELLDYATSSSRKPSTRVILGPAGFGMSTLLYALAGRLVEDRAGPVFMLKEGVSLLEGDVVFAASLFPDKRPFFVIDNAADFSDSLLDSIYRLRDAGRPALFLMAERVNEWRQRRGRLNASENILESLSDPEITRLLAYLEKHGELGVLEGLTPALRFAAIKNKHGKQLLVAMREAIEDNQFDAILEDEYSNMGNELAKRLYLIVCCFSQHGALIRDTLLAELLDISITDMYKLTAEATEGVVVYDLIDPVRGSYIARARHRTIAAVVWERCGDIISKESLLLTAVKSLNLNYKPDADAFEQFIRSERLVDSLRTLDSRTLFFETAIQKDPEGPYVRQHYARMLNRADKPELALSQIEKAIELDSSIRVLYHTQGLVLAKLATVVESVELGRRRMLQAEQAYQRSLNIYDKDEYSYASLSRLYLDWAKKVPNESSDYIAKSESVISQGLRVVANKERLWVASAEIQAWLGDEPGRLQDLERAITEHPKAVYPRYLIAQAYRSAGEPQKAIDKLESVLKENPDEFRLCIEYARALEDLGKPYEQSIAILNFGSLYGLRDARFIAIYAGMLFMNRDFSEADRVFSETTKREINFSDSHTIHYRPRDKGDPSRNIKLAGKVVQVKAGYAYIEVAGYSRFLCPSSKQRNIVLREKMQVEFEPAFSAKNALADKPMDLFNGPAHRRPV
jgi:tetratricopeptide (TPR) repeat protein